MNLKLAKILKLSFMQKPEILKCIFIQKQNKKQDTVKKKNRNCTWNIKITLGKALQKYKILWEICNFLRHPAGRCDVYHGQVKHDNRKKHTSGFPVSSFQTTLSLELMEKSQIAGKIPQGKHKTARSRRYLQLCHTKYRITFSPTYFCKVRNPFPTKLQVKFHTIKLNTC